MMLRILASVEPEKENYGLEDIDFSSVEIGSEIPAYKVENGQLVNANIRLIPFFLMENLLVCSILQIYRMEKFLFN